MKNINKFEVVSRYYNKDGTTDIIIPKRQTTRSAGYDFYAPENIILLPDVVYPVHTGIKVQCNDYTYLAIAIRSSMAVKHGVGILNGYPVIDGDYYNNPDNEGEIIIPLYLLNGYPPYQIMKGERFAQGIFHIYGVTYDDKETNVNKKREGGIGSTGVE